MNWVVDATAAQHSGCLADYLALVPALDRALGDDRCTVLAMPALASRLEGTLGRARLRAPGTVERLGRPAPLQLPVRRAIRELRPDAVLCGQYAPVPAGAPYVLRMTDAHLVDTENLAPLLRFYSPGQRLRWRLRIWAFRRAAAGAAAIVCATDAVRDQVLEACPELDPGRLVTAPFGPSPLLARARRHPGPRGRRLLTMHASPRKNIETILEALARPELDGWSLTVLGDLENPETRYTRFLADRVAALGLAGRVRSAGYIADTDRLIDLMIEHDVLVTPSRIESWNHTLVEALGMGMPAIASNSACHREVAGGGAWLVGVEDAEALAAAALEIEAGGQAVEDRIGRGLEVVASYSWDRHAEAVVATVRSAAEAPAASASGGGAGSGRP